MKQNSMKCIAIASICVASLFSMKVVMAADVLTATPVTYMLSSELLKETSLTTKYLPPNRYGIERLPNWFANKGAKTVQDLAKTAQVVVTIGAVWADDPLYVNARYSNIQIIEVDASQAITPRAQGVAALRLSDGTTSKYAWLNPTNLIRMVAIVSDDFQRIWPDKSEQIQKNQEQFMLSVRQLINQQQKVILENDIDSVILLSEQLEDFASGNQLFVVDRLTKPALEWTEDDKAQLKDLIEEDESVWIITTQKPNKQMQALLPMDRVLVVDAVDRWGRAGINTKAPLQRWQLAL
ncbi:ABC transporter substrate-binding protein [Aliivibrio sp. 1S165]|uniref:metal ABC transporter solute-binding protein, Zn/Mn family n=1 Tax=unclassified Aliivibrio TaxID=2645654 RepID=UPI00080DC906|nr:MULTISPECIES: zinc ABC transporter substrate-binding protein [unclassified Aliivibrio]OCH16012.1 ABC transporter substrate-binding protein [Aliivibrio sp. 1S165]OCH26947.1 ABC transporter substrate-binding protein [Aliivibrio sp. 1S175]